MINKSKLVVLSLTLALILGISTLAMAGSAGSIFKFGTDAKSLAMGGAFVAVADNYSATYWNPAGLNQAQGVKLGGMNFRPYDVQGLNFTYGGGAFTLENFTVGGAYGQFGVDLGEEYGYDSDASYSESVIVGSGAFGVDFADIGANVKSYNLGDSSGFGFDVGTLFSFSGLSVGASASDIGGVDVGEDATVSSVYRLGAAADLMDVAVASAQVDLVEGGDTTIRAGLELTPIKQLAVRGGVIVPPAGDVSFTAGAGLNLAGLTVDVAWLQNSTAFSDYAGDTLVLSAGFEFSTGE